MARNGFETMIDQTDKPAPANDASRTAARLATACAALAVSAVLLSPEPVRAKTHASPTLAAAKWAAQPAALTAGMPASCMSEASQPVRLGGFVATSRFVTTPTPAVIRLAARTRQGGRYGP